MIIYNEKENGLIVNGNISFHKKEYNRSYKKMLKEIQDGDAQLIPYAASPLTVEQYISLVQSDVLDAKAKELGFDNIFTAATYADEHSVPEFQQHGLALRHWRSLVWAKCYEIMADIEAGNRATPSIEELKTELPQLPQQ